MLRGASILTMGLLLLPVGAGAWDGSESLVPAPAAAAGAPDGGSGTAAAGDVAALLRLTGPSALFAQGRGNAGDRGQGNAGQGRRDDAGPPRQGNAGQARQGNAGQARQDNPGQARQGNAGQARQRDRATGAAQPGRGAGSPAAGRNDRGNAASPAAGRTDDGPGRAAPARAGARRGRPDRAEARRLVATLPAPARAMVSSTRAGERMAAGALAFAAARGIAPDRFDIRRDDDRVRVLNSRGDLLLDLRDDRARDLGAWELRRLGDERPRANAPAFCRSGAGHPVWGREWCLDRGFGLGGRDDLLWSRGRIDDIIYRRTDRRDRYDRGGLIDVLGDVVMGRLALHALSLGLVDPLAGSFVDEPTGPRLLRVHSGDVEVAEFVDDDRDGAFTVLYVATPRGY